MHVPAVNKSGGENIEKTRASALPDGIHRRKSKEMIKKEHGKLHHAAIQANIMEAVLCSENT